MLDGHAAETLPGLVIEASASAPRPDEFVTRALAGKHVVAAFPGGAVRLDPTPPPSPAPSPAPRRKPKLDVLRDGTTEERKVMLDREPLEG